MEAEVIYLVEDELKFFKKLNNKSDMYLFLTDMRFIYINVQVANGMQNREKKNLAFVKITHFLLISFFRF